MIHTIREAFNDLLADNHWMDDETRGVAKQKADAMNERIGYPQEIVDTRELVKEYASVCSSPTRAFSKILANVAHVSAERVDERLHGERAERAQVRGPTEPAEAEEAGGQEHVVDRTSGGQRVL